MSLDFIIGGSTAAPSGAAGGDLSGTFPNPGVAKVAGVTPGTGVATALGNTVNASGGITTPDGVATLTNKTIGADNIRSSAHVSTSTLTITATTTLATIPGFSQVLTAGGTYIVRGTINFGTAPTSSNGLKLQPINGDTLTVTSITTTIIAYANGIAPIVATATALASGLNSTAAMTTVAFEMTIVVNAGGTLLIQAAEGTASGTVTIPGGAAYMICERVS